MQAAGLMNMHANMVPISLLSDSYKASHFMQYPDCKKMVAYGEFRAGFDKDKADTRLVSYGIRYVVENYVARKWTLQDVQQAALFFKSHLAPDHSDFPFPKEIFEKFVNENDGWFPIKLEALLEGTCVNAHVPIYQITAEGDYARLCTFLETVLTQVWYPTCVATLSRRSRDIIEAGFERSAEGGAANPLLRSRLHDFGCRGCTCVEQTVLGGCAHLLNFDGTDTMSAAYYAQFALNGGRPVAVSIPATEHSVMTAWSSERQAIENMINQFGGGLFSIVMDSYDYSAALSEVLPVIAERKVGKGGFMVLRPDSGDPVEVVLQGLEAGEKVFGVDVNAKGFKVPRGWGVIQGDGINIHMLAKIMDAVLDKGFSAEAVAFGMGGGLLQKVNRDTMQFATKLCHIVYADGSTRDIAKMPKTDVHKCSLPGVLGVKRVGGVPTAFPSHMVAPEENLLQVVYDCGPLQGHTWDDFDTVRKRVAEEWPALPKTADVISTPVRDLIAQVRKEHFGRDQLVGLDDVWNGVKL